jgi:hypothetical protein
MLKCMWEDNIKTIWEGVGWTRPVQALVNVETWQFLAWVGNYICLNCSVMILPPLFVPC